MNGEDGPALEAACLSDGRGFEWFAMGSEPGIEDAVAANAGVHTAGDRLHLRQFGHVFDLKCPLFADP